MDSSAYNPKTDKASILVADDETDILELISETLADENCTVTTCSPDSLDDNILKKPYDVVVLDIFMPHIDGFTLREEVLKHSPHAQFILITAHPNPDLMERATGLGIYGFLTKPFTVEQIKYTVMGALRMRKLLQKKREHDDTAATKRIDILGALRRIDAIINCIGEGLLAIDNNNAVVLMNGVAEKITGIRFGESAGVQLDHCGVKKEVKKFLLPRLADTIPALENNILKIDTDGAESRYYSVNIQDIIDGSGERTGRVILFMDRTEAQNMERLKESFLSVAAHELRTPITIMMNYLCLLRKKDDDSEMRAIALNDMISANRRMKNIVSSIINFIMLSARDVPTYASTVDVGAIIREEIVKLEPDAKEKNITFELAISLASPRFFSDPNLVIIAVHNVLSNAIKFNRENGVVLIKVKNRKLKEKPGIAIEVSDQGEGLPPRVAEGLFESFRQGEDHLTRVHSGLGTGLFLAQRAVMLLGGALHAESIQAGGSRFSLELPCSRTIDVMHEITSDNH